MGAMKTVSAALTEKLFTAPEVYVAWPQARRHTQWPGEDRVGDPVFHPFYASQVPSLCNAESERLMQAAGSALLDRIGPAILIAHSQGSLFGWLIADSRPA